LLVKMTLAAATPADAELLRRYAEERSETAFAELVRRHLDLVHSAALRQVGGNRAAAADIAQAVFTELARQANHLTRHPALVGWLYTTTHRLAARHVRDETRRQRRERDAHAMQETHRSPDPEADWNRLAPVLDEAMHELADADRLALLLRHFEQRPFADVGTRLGLSENAARMRVDRALDKLRARLAKRGITSTGSALVVALGGPAVVAAPAGLAANIAAGAMAAGALTASSVGLLSFMASSKLKVGAVIVGFGLLGTALFVQQQHMLRLRTERSVIAAQLAEQSVALRDAQQLAARKEAQLADSRDSGAELLRLRGEVARLRRQTAKPSARPEAKPDTNPDNRPGPPLITNVRTQVPPGGTMVVGGWNWSEGRRALLFLTPETRQDDGKSVVDVESRITLIPEGTLTEFGLGRFATSDDPEAHEMMATAQVQEMFDRLFQRKDIETLQSAQMTTGDGQQAAVGISSDDLPDVVVVEVTPTVLPDGRIDVTLAGKLRPRPDAKAP
jgi:RNA polymerase sigma factor (sigma-70 family)